MEKSLRVLVKDTGNPNITKCFCLTVEWETETTLKGAWERDLGVLFDKDKWTHIFCRFARLTLEIF